MDINNCYVLGKGAIGGLLAAYSRLQNKPVKLLSYQQQKISLSFTELSCQVHKLSLSYQAHPDSPIAMLILPLKSYQIVPALEQYAQHLSASSIIVLMHNGLGTVEPVRAMFPDNPIVFASTTHGAYKPTVDALIHTGKGETQMGLVNGKLSSSQDISGFFNQYLLDCHWHQDIMPLLWQKLVVNCVINPLTAIHQCRNGQLAEDAFAEQIEKIVAEVCRVAKCSNVQLDAQQTLDKVHQVIRLTGNNYSSMNRDLEANRRSEIDSINGYVVSQAQKHTISVPENQSLYKQIQLLEQSAKGDKL